MTDTQMHIPAVCLNCRWNAETKPNRGDEYDASLPMVATCAHDPEWVRIVDARIHWCAYYEQTEQPRYTVPVPAQGQEAEDDEQD